jgi:Domain of unknown function (DUF6504)
VTDAGEQFVSEALQPVAGTLDLSGMARGEPGLPRRFIWRDEEHEVAEVLETWKSCGLSSGDLYLRRHWYKIRTQGGLVLTIYCQRTGVSKSSRKSRWWVYSMEGREGLRDQGT